MAGRKLPGDLEREDQDKYDCITMTNSGMSSRERGTKVRLQNRRHCCVNYGGRSCGSTFSLSGTHDPPVGETGSLMNGVLEK